MLDGKATNDGYQHDEDEGQDHHQQQGGMDESYAVPVPPPDAQPVHGESASNGDADLHDETAREAAVNLDKAREAVFHHGGYPLMLLVASIILMIAASTACGEDNRCSGKYGFAVAASVISLVVCLAFLVLDRQENLTPKLRITLVVFLFVWWVMTAGFSTFGEYLDAPFAVPGNGYFAAWGGLVAALFMLSNEVQRVHETLEKFKQVGPRVGVLLVASLVVMFAGVSYCDNPNGCTGAQGYAVAAGLISFVATLARLLLASKLGESAIKFYIMFMIVWWGIALVVLTFFEPFQDVGNGYFGTWACLISSVMLLNQ